MRKILMRLKRYMSDYDEKWYMIGTFVGMLAGITIGWLMFGFGEIII